MLGIEHLKTPPHLREGVFKGSNYTSKTMEGQIPNKSSYV